MKSHSEVYFWRNIFRRAPVQWFRSYWHPPSQISETDKLHNVK